jgi:hypothetical protein
MDGLDLGILSAGTGYWYEILNKLIFIRYNTYVPVNEILLLSANSFRHFCFAICMQDVGERNLTQDHDAVRCIPESVTEVGKVFGK